MGLFYPFKDDADVAMIGVEAAGKGMETGLHAASIAAGEIGVLHGNKTYLLQEETGQIRHAHSIAPGLDYPGVGPEPSYLRDCGRVAFTAASDREAVRAMRELSEVEGIIPALESSHAVAAVMRLAPRRPRGEIVILNLSGRGDKDIDAVTKYLGDEL